jgi:hypothetical protein
VASEEMAERKEGEQKPQLLYINSIIRIILKMFTFIYIHVHNYFKLVMSPM